MPIATHSLRPRIANERIVLRRFEAGDVDALYEAAARSRSEIAPWMPWCHEGYCQDDARQYLDGRPAAWERGEEYGLAIIDARTDQFLGCTGINQVDSTHRSANLGYWVRSDRTGEGVATEAVRLLAPVALEDLRLERIEIVAAVGNHASQRVAEKAGAFRESVARKRLRAMNRQVDGVCYSFIRDDFGLPPLDD